MVESELLKQLSLGISQYRLRIIKGLQTLLRKGEIEEIKRILSQTVYDSGTEDTLSLLRSAVAFDEKGWGATLETLIHLFGVSELSGIDCDPVALIDDVKRKVTSWRDVEDVTREIGSRVLDGQIACGDVHLLMPSEMKHPSLLPRCASILDIRAKQNESIRMTRLPSGDVNLTRVFGSAQGFDLLVNAKIGPIVSGEEAKKAIKLLRKSKMINKAVVIENLEKEAQEIADIRDFSHLFEGYTPRRKHLLDGVIRTLDTSPTAESGVEAIHTIGHPISKAPLEFYIARGGTKIIEALQGMQFFSLEGVERQLLSLLDNPDPMIRIATVSNLDGCQSLEVISKLLEQLKSGNIESVQVGIVGLTSINEPDSLRELIEFLPTLNPFERGAHADFLAKTKSLDVVPTLIDLLFFDAFTFIEGRHIQLINALTTTSGGPEKEKMNEMMVMIREKVTRALGSMGEISSTALIGILEELTNPIPINPIELQYSELTKTPLQRIGTWAKLRTKRHLDHKSPRLLGTPILETIAALGQTGSVEGIPILEKLVGHGDKNIRFMAIEALSEIDEPASDSLLRIKTDRDDELEFFLTSQIGSIVGKGAEEFLISKLKTRNPLVRTVAYSFLAARCRPEYVTYIKQGIKDKDRQVRLGLTNMLIQVNDSMYDTIMRTLEKDKDKQIRQLVKSWQRG
ncbi:MAG: HEAT repeat domain-containing protein [Candidatus Thorarchaeota archaeon]